MNLTKKELNNLITIDNKLLRVIWECPKYTSVPMMFPELKCVPIEAVIMKRRIMFLHYLLNLPHNSLLSRCFQAQTKRPLKGDWIHQVKQDLIDFQINLSFENIKSLSKLSFRKIVNEKSLNYSFDKLMKQKENHSRCKDMKYDYFKVQDYISSKLLTTQQKKLLFQMKVRVYLVFCNIHFKSPSILCPCCLAAEDSMGHQLVCVSLNKNSKV